MKGIRRVILGLALSYFFYNPVGILLSAALYCLAITLMGWIIDERLQSLDWFWARLFIFFSWLFSFAGGMGSMARFGWNMDYMITTGLVASILTTVINLLVYHYSLKRCYRDLHSDYPELNC